MTHNEDEEYGGYRRRKAPRVILFITLALVMLWVLTGQFVEFYLNVLEFGDIYLRPIYFELLAGIVLASIVLVRVDIMGRRSIVWWVSRLVIGIIRERGVLESVPPEYFDFTSFKLPLRKFLMWQLTKALILMVLFRDVVFGMVLASMAKGWDPGLAHILKVPPLVFTDPPFDEKFAQGAVIPAIPALTLLLTPILSALGLRLLALVGVTQVIRVVLPTRDELGTGFRRATWRIAIAEGLVSIALLWTAFNLLFPSSIDFNSRYVVGLAFVEGGIFGYLSIRDATRPLKVWNRKAVMTRVLVLVIIAMMAGATIAINSSTAEARKVQWRGPYVAQQISVNRHLAELNSVEERVYQFGTKPLASAEIKEDDRELLSKVRLRDTDAAFAKLKPEIGLIPFIDFQDSDIIRFNGTLYWSASMKPVLPSTVRTEDRWYAQHLYYTHVPSGFLLLDASGGKIVNSSNFFSQRRVYYGEGGLFSQTFAAYPEDRERSDELGGYFYRGKGGVTSQPPMSWLYEVNFLLGYREKAVHLLRYRDVFSRMNLLYPYFQYQFAGERVDIIPVTDGPNTYWLLPLIISLETNHVPWGERHPIRRLVGFALIDTISGSIRIILTGKDFFTEFFKRVYADVVEEGIPGWLVNQLRYPQELLEWRVSMYNFYHVRDPSTFIVAREFFEVPRGLTTYYIYAKPPGFNVTTYVGLLSLELRGAGGRNLAGYVVVNNDYAADFGKLIFYKVPLESETKLLGPTAVLEALEKNPDFAQRRTLLRAPRIGDIILYRIGDHDVYFIPVYTAGEGGVVTELGAVAAVGASFKGSYYVGLSFGRVEAEEAFRNYLRQLGGVAGPTQDSALGFEERVAKIKQIIEGRGLKVFKPEAINPNVSFSEGRTTYSGEKDWGAVRKLVESFVEMWGSKVDKVLMWREDSKLMLGVMVNVGGLVEMHFVTIELK